MRQLWLHPATMLEERYWRLASNPPSEKTAIAHTGSAYQQWKQQGNLSSSVAFRHLTSMSKIKGNHRKIHYIVPPLPWQDTQVYLTLPLEKGVERKKQRLLETCRAEMPLGVHTLLPLCHSSLWCSYTSLHHAPSFNFSSSPATSSIFFHVY